MPIDSSVCIEENGSKKWIDSYGEPHRIDGPASEYSNGNKCWYIHGQRHNDSGPAMILGNGWREWYLNGYQLEFYDWLEATHRFNEDNKIMIIRELLFSLKRGKSVARHTLLMLEERKMKWSELEIIKKYIKKRIAK